jgi:membrane protease YdiL (CAAX protease family)
MLWKKEWAPEAVLMLLGGILVTFFCGSVAAGLLRHAGVHGFRRDESVGSLLLATLSFHGAVLVLGAVFLKFQNTTLREVLGAAGWKRNLGLPCVVLLVVAPVMFGLKSVSELVLVKLHWPVEDQEAVELILGASVWMRCYMVFFAIILAPVAEEFVFRGLLFSTAKRYGWPRLGWIGVSLLFALVHFNVPTFLPLFVLALGLTWLYDKTEGLLAPIIAHSLFNLANLVILLLAEKYGYLNS